MDPIIIMLICAASLVFFVTLAGFVRQLTLSRDKRLNEEAQRIAMQQTAEQFKQLREELFNNRWRPNYEQVLGTNKERLIHLAAKIDELFKKKEELLNEYSEFTIRESSKIINEPISKERTKDFDKLKENFNKQIACIDQDLILLQQERSNELKMHTELNDLLLKQEAQIAVSMHEIYQQHSRSLEKTTLRHIEHAEHVAVESINAGTLSFQSMMMAPVNFLMSYFSPTTALSLPQVLLEQAARFTIVHLQQGMLNTEFQNQRLLGSKAPGIESKTPEEAHEEEISPTA